MSLETLQHCLVDVFYKEKITVAYVKEIKSKRLHLLLPTGREELINHSALLSLGKTKILPDNLNYIEALLKEKQALREKHKESFDLKELWEVVVDELEIAEAWDLVHLILGRPPDCDEVAGFMRKIAEEKLYFSIEGPDLVKIRSREEVANTLLQREKELERLRFMSEAENFLQALMADRTDLIDRERISFWINLLKEYILNEENFVSGKLLREVLHKHQLADPPKLVDFLVKKNYLEEDWFYELEKFKYPTQFSPRELEEVKPLSSEEIDFSKYIDLRDLYTFTIDAPETEDYDDALSIKKEGNEVVLFVHIAEVARTITPSLALWEGAFERASTLYLPETIYPMLPFPLSHKKFSLRMGEVKPSLTFKFRFSNSGQKIEAQIFPALISVKKRFTYEEVDQYLEAGDPFWLELYQLLKPFKEFRHSNGALAVILPEILVKVLPNKEIICKKIEMTPSRDLIAEAMILANFYGAKFIMENNLPGIYRAQKAPFQVIEERETSLFHQILQLKFMAKSELTLEPSYHSGLGLPYYTTLTSPIRRFLDLLNQYQILRYFDKKPFFTKEEFLKLLPDLQSNIARAQMLQGRRKKYFLLKYLKMYKKEEPLKGIILETQGRKYRVYLPEYNLTGEVLGYKGDLEAGREVRVKVEKVNPHLEILRLSID